jgi:MOSC domain-containing protein YiiM
MHIASVNVSRVREVEHHGHLVRTGIYKQPVPGRVALSLTNLQGDEQADPVNHGGPDMAVYAYTLSSYEHWRRELPGVDLPPGKLGENLTIAGLADDDVHIGDTFSIGPATGHQAARVLVQVSVPRAPCSKLAMTMGMPDFPKAFLASGRVGFYLRVLAQGTVTAGDTVTLVAPDPAALTVRQAVHLMYFDTENTQGAARAAGVEALAPRWRHRFAQRAGLA